MILEIILSVLFIAASVAFGGFLYRLRGSDRWIKNNILNFVWDTVSNSIFVVPLAVVAWLVTGSLWAFLLIIPMWWGVTQIGHGTVFFDQYPDHAPDRKRMVNGEETIVQYGHEQYQPWHIRWFTPFKFPEHFPWDIRWGLGVTAAWVVIFPIVVILAYGALIPAAILTLSVVAKPIAYYVGWNWFSLGLNPNAGTPMGEILYGAISYLFWSAAIALLFLGII